MNHLGLLSCRHVIDDISFFAIAFCLKLNNSCTLSKTNVVRIQVKERGMREGIANSQEWAEIASRKKAIAERA